MLLQNGNWLLSASVGFFSNSSRGPTILRHFLKLAAYVRAHAYCYATLERYMKKVIVASAP
jgi:hypothetical protein